jgi:hypothetical protein
MSSLAPSATLSSLETNLLQEYPVYDFSSMYKEGLIPLFDKNPSLYLWKSQYVFKLRGIKYEMNLAHLAGDCAVPVIGEVVKDGKQVGFLMRKEMSLDDCSLSALKKSIMGMMVDVVKELHGKEIIHGDIKLSNMLFCGDGKVRLCDFVGAFLKEHSKEAFPVYSIPYLSPYRALHLEGPLTFNDDLFALGVSIWELFTGKRPFQGMNIGTIRRLIREGNVVDISEIGDNSVALIVQDLMSPMLAKTPTSE